MSKASIAVESYAREISVPLGSNEDVNTIDFNTPITITITGKVKELRAASKKDEAYEGASPRPAEARIQVDTVVFEGVENTFTTLSRKMDEDED